MNKNKVIAIAFAGIVVIISAWLLAKGVTNFREEKAKIYVTGLAEKQITSDLIVWDISISANGKDRNTAFNEYKRVAKIMRKFLTSSGIADTCISTNSVDLTELTKEIYDAKTKHYITVSDGYSASQTFTVSSKDIDTVEKVYQNISELYNQGISFSSSSPLYYYTKLNELKMEMLEKASANAYERAQIIAKGSDASVGKLISSSMGVFQIVGLNSDEEYSWGGTFNTSSKEKVASITLKTAYKID
ncbi:hypothetical protein HMPREF0663_10092 [Hoylesella oralis ATCC 33269]|uniref:SIMPL domain-containing protein n=1 Tax=Hoylesella oralis ATCC 33269 TaxID=873533 RepID=E7RLU2_9BACT|nr:SIMPL domain-containing protein [Hoylesella oralis]EFZ37723.1 hypothetical protein HMPREF0663_10092 [Hoylesella oralis ATCC 33269]EPH16905.1 hypothetical protein HMPREF1475_01230 [Hoylesella oralis HGA0225]SHF47657.1 hypothetical protein SAMN05444288_0747 [Hoylesella oralis]